MQHSSRPFSGKQQRGAILLEIALTIPVFLTLVLFIVLFTVYQNASSTLTSAVFQANRLAITRAADEFRVIPTLNDFYRTGNISTMKGLLYHNGDAPQNYYMSSVGGEGYFLRYRTNDYSNISITEAPITYLYSLVYAYTFMKDGVGSSLRFPCDPRTTDGGGCMQCYFQEPVTSPAVWLPEEGLSEKHYSLVCEYRPDTIFLYMLETLGIIGKNSNFGLIRRRATT